MMPDALHPTTLTAADKVELMNLLCRASLGEFRISTMEYGHGRPGKPFCKLGIIWKEEKQESFDL